MDNRPIGFFDSGIGGLTCIAALQKKLPNERVVYYGDTARTPYGSKSIETIKRFSFQISDYLISHDVKMIVIACNTISATCLTSLRRRYPSIPITGVIEPIANKLALKEKNEIEIGMIGTKATVGSGIYSNLITSRNRKVKLFSKACPALVPLIEEGIIDNEIMNLTLKYYLDDFVKNNNLKKLILGCTHYPLLRKNLKQLYPDLELLNPADYVIDEVGEFLKSNNLLAEENTQKHLCYASDISENLQNVLEAVFETNKDIELSFKRFED